MSDEREHTTSQVTQGRLLRRARLGAGLTQKAAAQMAGVSPPDLARCERGRQTLSLPHLELLSRAYGVPITHFWGEEIEPDAASPVQAAEYAAVRRKMIGVLLRQARLARGKTLNDCAEALGDTPARLAAIEFGEVDLPVSDLERLASLCGLPITYFADPDLVPAQEQFQTDLMAINQMPEDVREFVSQPANVLYIKVAMLLSELSVETLRKLGEGLLDITL